MDELGLGWTEALDLDHVERVEMMKELTKRRKQQAEAQERARREARGRR